MAMPRPISRRTEPHAQADGQRLPKTLFIKTYGCQMNVYDSARMAETLTPLGYAADRSARGGRYGDPQYLPYPGEGGGEAVLGARPAARPEGGAAPGRRRADHRGGGLRRPGGRGGDPAPRARMSISCSAPRPIIACPRWWRSPPAAPAPSSIRNFPSNRNSIISPQRRARPGSRLSSRCRKAATSSAASASCPIPAGRRRRARRRPCWPRLQAWSARGAREITLLGQNVNAYHGAGPDGAEWGLARLIGALARIPDLARIRYTTSHPADMDDGPDRRPWRGIEADALPASAGAVGLGPHPGGDEPQASRGGLSGSDPAPAQGAAGSRPLHRYHRRLSRRERSGFRRHFGADRGCRLRRRLLLQIQPAARHAGGGCRGSAARAGQGRTPGAGPGPARPPEPGLQPIDDRPPRCRSCSSSPAAARDSSRAAAPICRPCMRRVRRASSAASPRSRSASSASIASAGVWPSQSPASQRPAAAGTPLRRRRLTVLAAPGDPPAPGPAVRRQSAAADSVRRA